MAYTKSLEGGLPSRLPLLPLLNEALLPAAVAQLRISSESRSCGGLVAHLASSTTSPVLLVVVPVIVDKRGSDRFEDDENLEGLHSMGTVAQVQQLGKVPQTGESTLVIEGITRIKVFDLQESQDGKLFTVAIKLPSPSTRSNLSKVLRKDVTSQEDALGTQLLAKTKSLLRLLVQHIGAPAAVRVARALGAMPAHRAADTIIGILASSFKDKIEALNTVEHVPRIKLALRLVKKAGDSVKESLPSDTQKSHWPALENNRISVQNMGGHAQQEDEGNNEITQLLTQLKENGGPDEVVKVASREAKRLQKLGEHHPGYAMAKSYLEVLADLPWQKLSAPVGHTLRKTREILDSAHYGLDKIKDRVIQYIAVQKLRGAESSSPILCFVGPPGVGKTSLAKSIADVLEKSFIRISLGGVRDEAEIRGHRKTYIGAMPGRIVNGLRRAGVRDPVILLDEVDKMGHDVRGDPSSALLEVLDPEQNSSFVDTYVGLPFDLSRVVFVTTANQMSEIPSPLLDRLEVIQLPGYTVQEKIMIGMRHLLPKVLDLHGLNGGCDGEHGNVIIPKDILEHVIMCYTREAGVRGLERSLAAICRFCAAKVVSENETQIATSSEQSSAMQQRGSLFSGLDVIKRVALSRNNGWSDENPAHALGVMQLFQNFQAAIKPKEASAVGIEGLKSSRFLIDKELVEKILGPPKFISQENLERICGPGIAAGLVWTPVGGMVQYIECCCTNRGQSSKLGQLTLTGQLGDVLEESAMIALSWIRSNAALLGLIPTHPLDVSKQEGDAQISFDHNSLEVLQVQQNNLAKKHLQGVPKVSSHLTPVLHWDIHVHLPSGGIPKDGPSAGITIACALLSLFCGRALRPDTAMTGELTLRGLVLPVGGVKEKCLAAHQAGMKRVLIPRRNIHDVEAEISREVRSSLKIVGVDTLEDVLASAFNPPFSVQKQSKL